MRTTLALDDDLVRIAQEFTGVAEKTALIREALKALIERESARRLASLEGAMPKLKNIPRPQAGDKLILADTSIGIDHFRSGSRSRNNEMRKHLNEGRIMIHPSIIAEFALGSLQERS